jgi:hypothetical protein
MLLAQDARRHARVCARLVDGCDDPHLAERVAIAAFATHLVQNKSALSNLRP